MKIGFIGQGFVGKNIANDFESRGFEVVRYALEAEYVGNKETLKECEAVFVAVPTPSTPEGFDYSVVEQNLVLLSDGTVVIIKSTILPGTTRKLQDTFPNLVILFSPEFLCEATASHDAAHPILNIIGIFSDSAGHRTAAETIMSILPHSENTFIVPIEAAELFKYIHNIHGFTRVILSNLFYDLAQSLKVDWTHVEQIMNVDPMMSPYYNAPMHKSGRGAGGHCFIKDMAAFIELYETLNVKDEKGKSVLRALESKNLELLASTNKDQDLVSGVYGENISKI